MGAPFPPRPTLRVTQGASFRYAVPDGWTANETGVGVDLRGPAPGTSASLTLVFDGAGLMTPEKYLRWMLGILGLACVDFHRTRELPDESGPGGLAWKVTETVLSHTLHRSIIRACLLCGICQDGPRYAAAVRAFQAPARTWSDVQGWLPLVAQSITITDPERVTGHAACPLPRVWPQDPDVPALATPWPVPGADLTRLSECQFMPLGYEELADPRTGELYEVPKERYDPVLGGYRNPARPDELLIGRLTRNPEIQSRRDEWRTDQ